MLSWYWLQLMIYHVSSLAFDLFIPVDFGSNVLFPNHDIFSVLHCNSVETCWFSFVMHESPLTEEVYMQSSLDSHISMLLPPVLAQSAFALQNKIKTLWSFWVFWFLVHCNWPERVLWTSNESEAMRLSSIRPVRSDWVARTRNWTQHFHQALRTGCVLTRHEIIFSDYLGSSY